MKVNESMKARSQKTVIIVRSSTSYLNFTQCNTTLPEKNSFLKFQCMFCDLPPFKAKLGATSNIKAYLQRFHTDIFGNWFEVYDKRKISNSYRIDDNTLKIVKYFVSSNTAYKESENPYLRDLIPLKLPCKETFSEVIIKKVMDMLHTSLNNKLKQAKSICLISDIWSNKQMLAFLGLAALITNEFFEKEPLVIGMVEMPERHCSEDIKKAIESIINTFNFDYSKIHGNTCIVNACILVQYF